MCSMCDFLCEHALVYMCDLVVLLGDNWCLHARIMLALSNIHRAIITSQVKGSANIMVIVAATQELRAGDFLLRFKAEASQDDIHGSSARPVFRNCCYIWDSSRWLTCV